MNRKRKAAIKAMILARMEAAFKALYHNATLVWPKDLPEDMELYLSSEAQWEELQFHYECALGDINKGYNDEAYIDGYIAESYGQVYTYGRGGRTCAPEKWTRNDRVSTPETDDMDRWAILRLALDAEAWNAYVKAECSAETIKDVLMYRYEEAKEEAEDALKAKVERLVRIS